MKRFKGQPAQPGVSPARNSILQGDGFYVSFLYDNGCFGGDTTALVLGEQMEAFYILNGDHREAYAGLVSQGLDACLDYFRSKPEMINHRSDQPPPADTPAP